MSASVAVATLDANSLNAIAAAFLTGNVASLATVAAVAAVAAASLDASFIEDAVLDAASFIEDAVLDAASFVEDAASFVEDAAEDIVLNTEDAAEDATEDIVGKFFPLVLSYNRGTSLVLPSVATVAIELLLRLSSSNVLRLSSSNVISSSSSKVSLV